MKICEKTFGILSNGKEVTLYTLSAGDLEFSLTNYGATWTSLIVPSRRGSARGMDCGKDDILLGFTGLDGYFNNVPYFGVTVGRFANRIKGASFTLNGKEYHLDANAEGNNLHSGWHGFDRALWKAESYEENDGVFVRFEYESPVGEGGFPGNMKAVVIYGLTKDNKITADYSAEADEPCPVNLTNHAYFNLAGEKNGNILSHNVTLHSSSYLEVDNNLIPTGRLTPVKDTAFDFKQGKKINRDFNKDAGVEGYDHCFVVDGEYGKLRPCAEVSEPDSGRLMKVMTTQPAVQFYTGNFLSGIAGKQGSCYFKHSGFCLETQHFPDSPNNSAFPSCITDPSHKYHEKAEFSFIF